MKKVPHTNKWKGKIQYAGTEQELNSPSQVEAAVIRAQNALAGEGVGISHNLITLEITSHDVPDLTLIDLPGITRVAVRDQPQDIGQQIFLQIMKLIKKYITKQETINLVVIPSNVDIATMEALKMAQEVDPEGERTLGILTKPDLVDPGAEEEVVDIVRNQRVLLRKGYMIVKCRGQEDIKSRVSLADANQKERRFFEEHEVFSCLLEEHRATIPLLAERLTQELIDHINKLLPNLEEQIKDKLEATNLQLQQCGQGVPETPEDKMFFLIQKIKYFNNTISKVQEGEEVFIGPGKRRLFTAMRQHFNKWQTEIINNALDVKGLLKDEILNFEIKYRGKELPGFVNYRTFENIVKQQIEKLQSPALEMLKDITEQVRETFFETATQQFSSFYFLLRAAQTSIEDIREKQQETAESIIKDQFKLENVVYCQDYIYSEDIKQVRGRGSILQVIAPKRFLNPADKCSMEEMAYHLNAYFKSAGVRLGTQIPMIIQKYILQDYAEGLQNAMMGLLQDKDQYNVLLQEQKDVASKRVSLKERLKRLTRARQRLAKYPNMSKFRACRQTPSERRSRKLERTLSSDEEMDGPLKSGAWFGNKQTSEGLGIQPMPGEVKFAVPNLFVPQQNGGFTFNPPSFPNGDASEAVEQKQTNKKPENSLYNQYEEKIRPCIDLIDSLRALGVEKDLALPAIAVIGDQSSGKSSVLEALSGVALPRGSGIVTRCPLALKLKKLSSGQQWKGKISYLDKNLELTNASEVEREIRRAQNIMAGEGVGISNKLINLEISSPEVPDLTLIDLPGIARVAVGNQPLDIGDQIKKLIKTYIDRNETINLVVVPCNVDIATTEALKMAQEVDPEGERTLGILTKPDLMDKGTEGNVVNIVRNLVIPLKKGYMIVKCRGQQDIQSNLTLASATQREREFFENHKHFSMLWKEKRATIPLLAEKLTSELVQHISKSLPTLEEQISFQLQKASDEMRRYGKGMPKTEGEKLYFLTDKIQLFNADITCAIQGEEKLSEKDTRLFTKIRKEFQKWDQTIAENGKNIEKSLHPEEWKFEHQYRGRELPGFINYRTFESIMRRHISILELPALEMLNKVTEIVRQAFAEVAKAHFDGFPHLHMQAKNRIESIKAKQIEEAESTIRTQFEMEQTLYCQDGVYRRDLSIVKGKVEEAGNSLFSAGSLNGKNPLNSVGTSLTFGTTSAQDSSITEIAYHLKTYFSNAGNRLSCQVPLIIQFYILQKFGDHLQNEMLQLLQNREKLSILLQERKDAAEQRQFLSDRIFRLTEARNHLAKFSG
nr:interferon-induced GTP-binding protein Mx2-like [Pogona vitticeps]